MSVVSLEVVLRRWRFYRIEALCGLLALMTTSCARASCSEEIPSRAKVNNMHADSLPIMGRIRDRQTRRPVAGATIALMPADGTPGTGSYSNDSGVVLFKARTVGRYVLRVRRVGYSTFTREVTLRQGGGLRIDVELGTVGSGLNPTRCACAAAKVCM